MTRRPIFQAITGAIVASAMELGFVDKPRMICGFDPGFGGDAAIIVSWTNIPDGASGEWRLIPGLKYTWHNGAWLPESEYSRIREQKHLANQSEI